ncbi:MAG TPA: indole-3-glycerol phosphate synthase TrpC [Melioribacteraceae bacterium]|mgnify:CR=1 FL=1|nr:indole-3-glycerol phosphate synthase TrpC [Melioribacteraceae bacterium]
MNILNSIIEDKKNEVSNIKTSYRLSDLQNNIYKSISFKDAINNKRKINLIAEIKKASPSKGIIRKDFNYLEIGECYMKANVDAISILTDEKYFMGNIKYLEGIAQIKTVPLLRKDFIIDEVQIIQAKKHGADAILLISEILDKQQIKDFTTIAKELNMDILLELHSIEQLDKIDFSVNEIVGINNRNLKTFEVNINTTIEIKKHIPNNIIVVSESGIKNSKETEELKKYNINAVLVGEYFMQNENIYNSVKTFKEYLNYEN